MFSQMDRIMFTGPHLPKVGYPAPRRNNQFILPLFILRQLRHLMCQRDSDLPKMMAFLLVFLDTNSQPPQNSGFPLGYLPKRYTFTDSPFTRAASRGLPLASPPADSPQFGSSKRFLPDQHRASTQTMVTWRLTSQVDWQKKV